MNSEYYTTFLGNNLSELKKYEQFKLYFFKTNPEQIGKEYYLTNKQQGIGLVFNNDKTLVSIHLHDGLENDYCRFTGKLPKGLNFSDDISIAHKKIGILEYQSGGGETLPFLGLTKPWRKYRMNDYYLHIELRNNRKTISLITISLE
ncbi:MAG: hypothetical protein ACOCWM_04315 [Cyclobacteriaceae bacterium]